jgi:hypothetical protein
MSRTYCYFSLQLVKTGKPTGDGECPRHIERALEIEAQINERAGTREVNDTELDEPVASGPSAVIEISSDEEPEKFTVTTVKRPEEPRAKRPRLSGIALIEQIAKNLEPSAQNHRDSTRTEQNFSALHILTLNQQIQSDRQEINGLRADVLDLTSRLHAAESARDLAQLKLELMVDSRELERRASRASYPSGSHKRPRYHARPHVPDIISLLTDSDGDADKENRPILNIQPASSLSLKVEDASV